MKTKLFILLFLLTSIVSNSQIKILFDAKKAQSAGNADWVIDTDTYNLGFGSGLGIVGTGSESNPQRIPTPAQSGITATTPESFWNGGISSWAVDCVKQGYVVETLPNNGQISYGNASNVQDLSNYKVYIIDEPNISYTDAEKTAILNFVQNGGGLFMISDHDISDRNNDGVDSPSIFNDLMNTNSVQTNPFGINFNMLSISPNSSNIANLPTNPILHGTIGNVTQVMWSSGTSMTLNTTSNTTVRGLVYTNSAVNTGTTNVLCAQATYGNGKIVAVGDSSVADDGTGDGGDTLYDGYIADAGGNHRKLLMNATIWLASTTLKKEEFDTNNLNFLITPNPIINNELTINYQTNTTESIDIEIFDTLGRTLKTETFLSSEYSNFKTISLNNLHSGIYICVIKTNSTSKSMRFVVE
jgi:hypothetical protein